MRVIGGSARGRKLVRIVAKEIRPTPDRVREALFSIIYSRKGSMEGVTVLDLFAGSGALGIEALSRGANHAYFVDSSREAVATIKENLERCGFSGSATVIPQNAGSSMPTLSGPAPFDLIFADPPYSRDHAVKVLELIDLHGLLKADGLLCLETAAGDQVPKHCGGMCLIEQRRYGITMLNFYHLSHEALP